MAEGAGGNGVIALADVVEHEVELVAEDRPVKGVTGSVPPVAGRLSIGEPIVVALDAQRLDDVQAAHLATHPDQSFHLVQLRCSFLAGAGEAIDSAWFQVALTRTAGASGGRPGAPGDAAGGGPIAWSLAPLRRVDVTPVDRTVRLGADLTFAQALGVSPSVEVQTAGPRSHVWLRAVGEREANFAWEFRAGDVVDLGGSHDLVAVVRTPEPAGTTARLDVVVNVRRRRWGIFPYHARLDPATRAVRVGGRG